MSNDYIGPDYQRIYGSRYDPAASVGHVARTLRDEIRTKVRAGDLPDHHYRIRASRCSLGEWAIDITVTVNGPIWSAARGSYLPELCDLHDTLTEMLAEHNHDGSDSQFDWFDVKFYSHITILEAVER